MTRPKKETILKRDKNVMVRYTDMEYKLISQYAKESNYPIATFVRKRSLNENLSVTYNIIADIQEINKLVAEFGKIGNNLNQIAKYYNMGGIHSQSMQTSIQKCILQIFEMRKEILKMVGDYNSNIKTYHKQK